MTSRTSSTRLPSFVALLVLSACGDISYTADRVDDRAEEKASHDFPVMELSPPPLVSGEPAIEQAAEIYEGMPPEVRGILLDELAKIETQERRKKSRKAASMPSPVAHKKKKRSARRTSGSFGGKKGEAKKEAAEDLGEIIEGLDKMIEDLEPATQQQAPMLAEPPVDQHEKKD